MHKCHTEGGRYFIGSLAYISVSDQICKEIEIKPNKLSGDEEVQTFSGGGQTLTAGKQRICPDRRLQELCYWEKNKYTITVLKNKEYADISLLCLQLLTQNVAQNKPLINIC